VVVDVLLDAVVDELADHPARDSPDGDRRQQRRRSVSHKLSVTALGMGRITRFG
jgi:hypothetical protein